MFYELPSRDRGDGCAPGQPQGVGSEAYLNSTSQGPTPEDALRDSVIRGRSRQFINILAKLEVHQKSGPNHEG